MRSARGPVPEAARTRTARLQHGLPKVWDKEHGGWSDADSLPAWAWSSTLELLELDAAAAAAVPAAAESVAAAPRVAWETPNFWQLEASEKYRCEITGKKIWGPGNYR